MSGEIKAADYPGDDEGVVLREPGNVRIGFRGLPERGRVIIAAYLVVDENGNGEFAYMGEAPLKRVPLDKVGGLVEVWNEGLGKALGYSVLATAVNGRIVGT